MRNSSWVVLVSLWLACLAAPTLACSPAPPDPRPPCAPALSAGEWRAADGLVIQFAGPFAEASSERRAGGSALVVSPGSKPAASGALLYDRVRRVAGCTFLARRHLWLDLKIHPAPPHTVELELDPTTGALHERYLGEEIVYTRVQGPRR